MPKGYIIARVRVTDPAQYEKYRARSPEAVAAFGGRFIVRGGRQETLEGPADDRRTVILEYESYEKAREMYHSDLYSEIRKLRENAGEAQFLLVEGHDG